MKELNKEDRLLIIEARDAEENWKYYKIKE